MVIYDRNQLTFNIILVLLLTVSIVLNIIFAQNFAKIDETLTKVEDNQNFNFIQSNHNEIDYQLSEHGFLIRSSDDFGLFNGPSMQPTIFDQNTMIQEKYDSNFSLEEGQVIRFTREDGTAVIHRVRADYGDTVFVQGDSLKEGEIIDKSQITHVILGVLFT